MADCDAHAAEIVVVLFVRRTEPPPVGVFVLPTPDFVPVPAWVTPPREIVPATSSSTTFIARVDFTYL
ncbi:hypothetical protein C7I87_06620 [Mesorhizobium sp. SARCC-RB16n]|nr:hypothetical protein C7I87_06620 [Mesorhizobium sp. SARCC-RB16n]